MLRTVIFDFDGVITDSEILHLRAFNKVLARFNIEIDRKDYYTKYLGYTDADCYKQLIADGLLEVEPRQIPELIERKNHVFEELAATEGKTIDGVHEFLNMLTQNNVPMAICSGALLTEIELLLEDANLRHFFATIVSAEHVKKGKPHPEGFLLTLKKLNNVIPAKAGIQNSIAAAQCVVIEDSLWGLQAAKAAGMHSVAVTNSYDAEHLHLADKIVAKLSDLSMEDLRKLCV
ncbi:MAG: HAD family phosphatase [Sedimentisphaerales bacterium]|nr:HAD family phosphatase [Sedimentisphaerales bacterium]